MGPGPAATPLDWTVFDGAGRQRFVDSIDEEAARRSPSLDRITRLAATLSGAQYAQISLIGTSQFVPASHGLDYDDDHQHTPIPESLCSVTMAFGDTLGIDDARAHPWVRDLPPVASGTVGAYLGVPLRDPDGQPVGALCAFDRDGRAWDPEARAGLEDLAALVTRELHLLAALDTIAANEVHLRKVVGEIVDRPKLGVAGRLRARASYLMPADASGGGDWIDFTEVGEDRVVFSIGDVVGHGLDAVAMMDEIRHALRAYAFDSLDPAEALHRADRLLARVRPDRLATSLHGDHDAATHTVRLASAGQPGPILLHDGRARYVDVQPSPPLGFDGGLPQITTIPFGPGDRLVLVTDGVIERRRESLATGLDRLTAAVEAIGFDRPPGETARALLAELTGDHPADDACILVIDNFDG